MIAREDAERKARLDEETERIKKRYNVADTQEALKRYAADVDREFADIEKATNYVKVGLSETLAGKPISAATTQPYGCSIKYKS